jgi:predicted transcriptional regulator
MIGPFLFNPKKMKGGFISVHEWTFDVLEISGNDAIIFSYILGFKSKGYYGSTESLATKFRISNSTAVRCLNDLTSKQLLIKTKEKQFVKYIANVSKIKQMQQSYLVRDIVKMTMDDSQFDILFSQNDSQNDNSDSQNDNGKQSKRQSDIVKFTDNNINIRSSITSSSDQSGEKAVESGSEKDFYCPPSLKGKGYYKFIFTDYDWDRDWKDAKKIGDWLKPEFGNDIKMGQLQMEINERMHTNDIRSHKAYWTAYVHKCISLGAVPASGKMETL